MTPTARTLLGLLALVLFTRLGLSALLPFMDTTEPRYAEIARVMAESGDWITPWFDDGVPFWGKPPLSFWAQALSFKLLGVSEFSGRLPSWLANLGIVALVYVVGRGPRSGTDLDTARRTGLWAALVYATMALAFVSAGTVMTDSFLALGTTLTLASLILRLQGASMVWGWGFFIGLAIGLLAKGPLVLVLTGLPTLVWVLATGQWRLLWDKLPWLGGTAAMLAVSLPWYALAELKTPGFLNYFIVGEHFKRFLVSNWQGDLYGDAHQFARGTIWLYLLLASFPWGVIFLGALLRRALGASGGQAPVPRQRGETLLIVAAALTPAAFFTFAGNILWTYVLPGLPFVALLAARQCRLPAHGNRFRVTMTFAALIPVIGTGAVTWLTLHPDTLKTEKYLVQRFEQGRPPSRAPLVFLGDTPFSARFYSDGQAQDLAWPAVQARLATRTPPTEMFLAVNRRDHAAIQTLSQQFPAVDGDRRFLLFHLPGSPINAEVRRPDEPQPEA